MRIAIAGGTGTLGRRVAEELRSRGHDVRVLSGRALRGGVLTTEQPDVRGTTRFGEWLTAARP